MKGKGCTIGIIALVVIGIWLYSWIKGTYNDLVKEREIVKTEWAQVESQYQRRADLIPNLEATVKGYAKHEKETFEGVTNARANATGVKIDIDNLDEASLKKFQAAQGELSQALSRLIAVSENYPELKANEEFTKLMDQLEGTENRIVKARNDFNNKAKVYNTKVQTFPTNLLAGFFNFREMPYFQAEAGAEKAHKVSFD